MTTAQSFKEERIAIAGTELYLLKGGEGRPLLVLHGVEGHEGWLPFHDALSANATVYAPAHPGYGETVRPDWLETITHQAVFYHWFIDQGRPGRNRRGGFRHRWLDCRADGGHVPAEPGGDSCWSTRPVYNPGMARSSTSSSFPGSR